MGKLCNNTQYFVIEKRVGVGKPRKKLRELAGLNPPILKISDYE